MDFYQSCVIFAGGLVGPTKFAVMPDIPPAVPLVMVVIAIMPVLYTLWKNPNAIVFVKAITYCSLSRCGLFPSSWFLHGKTAHADAAVLQSALAGEKLHRAVPVSQQMHKARAWRYSTIPFMLGQRHAGMNVVSHRA